METSKDKHGGGCICGGNGITDGLVEGFSASGTQPLALEPTPKTLGRGIRLHRDSTVPPFLIKLYEIVDDKATASIISWGSSCSSFIIFDERRFILDILPSYFKASRFDSFTSQLHKYGFTKNDYNRLEFEHKHFQQGKQHLLSNIKRRSQESKAKNTTPMLCNTTSILQESLTQVRLKQKQINNKMEMLKDDVEITFSDIRNIIKDTIHKLMFNFSQGIGQKRKFVDIDPNIDFVNIEKDFESTYEENDVSGLDDADTFMMLRDLLEKVAGKDGGRGEGVNVGGNDSSCRAPSFLQKLYDMVEKKELDSYISWINLPCRDRFVIWDINNFAAHVLPMYFKHSNFSSFNSQLNIYCFKKVSWERHEYANEWFLGGRKDLLVNIKRREKYPTPTIASAMACSSIEVEMFNNRLKTIHQEQDKKITWLSNYEEQMKSSMHELKETVVNMANIVNKMMAKSNENLDENVKKAKVDIEEDVTGKKRARDSEIDERGYKEAHTSTYIEEYQEIDFEALEKIMEMEDSGVIERERDYYLSLCCGKSNDIHETCSSS